MAFSLDGSLLVSDVDSTTDYRIAEPMQRVLTTLPDQQGVPKAIVMVGILTEQLDPVESELDSQIEIVSQNIDQTPHTSVPDRTINGIEWLLYHLRETLTPTRKQKIGQLLQQAGLTSESGKKQSQAKTETDETEAESETNDTADETENKNTTEATNSAGESRQDSSETQTKYSTTAESGLNNSTETTTTETSSDHNGRILCEFCESTFSSQTNLVSHTVQCDSRPADAKYTCPDCGNTYVSETALERHHEQCSQDTESKSANSTGSDQDHTCEHCGTTFTKLQTWLEHEKSCQESRSGSISTGRLSQVSTTSDTLIAEGITGRVETYNENKGYGFILTVSLGNPEQDNTVFFHISEYPGQKPQAREKLRFDVRETEDGLKAEAISKTESDLPEATDNTFASDRTQWGQ